MQIKTLITSGSFRTVFPRICWLVSSMMITQVRRELCSSLSIGNKTCADSKNKDFLHKDISVAVLLNAAVRVILFLLCFAGSRRQQPVLLEKFILLH